MDKNEQPTTEAAAVANMALNAAGVVPVEVLELDGKNHVWTPKRDLHGTTVSVDHMVILPTDAHGLLTETPSRVAASVVVETQDSLVDYVRDFKGTGTRMFASIASNVIVAVLDYHSGRTDAVADMTVNGVEGTSRKPDDMADFTADPDHGQHVATLKLPYSEQWVTWTTQDGKLVDQLAFARFIQENAPDIETPDGATLLELVRDLRGSRTKKFTGDVNMAAARDGFAYEDRTDLRSAGELHVPDAFTLRLPVYFGGESVAVQAQLRFDVSDEGKLALGFKLLRREAIRQATFKGVVGDVGTRSGCPVVYGERKARDAASY